MTGVNNTDPRPPEETLAELYEYAPCGYVTLDAGGGIIRVNATLSGLLGFSYGGLIGKRVQELLTPAGRIFFETHVAPLLITEGNVRQVAIDLKCADGGRLPTLTDWRRVDVDGEVRGTRIMLVDATDRRSYERDLVAARERAQDVANQLRASEAKLVELNQTLEARVADRTAALEEAHEQLRQSQKLEAIGTLTGGVAHDFNNLLTPIIGGLDLLKRRGIGDERAQRVISGALTSAERAKTLVQRLLAFARRQPLQPVPVDLVALVRGMSALIGSTTGPQIKLDVQAEEGLPSAMADVNQIEMALLNLVVNARDAMPDGGALAIKISLAPEQHGPGGKQRHLVLSVRDTGVGMDETTRLRAIEPFFSTKDVGKGTGLGLSMVHGLAAQLEGRLEIESQLGTGTEIILFLPAASESASVAHSAGEPGLAKHMAGTVLLVDDEDLVRATTAAMLQDLGYEVVDADCGAAALSLINDGLIPDILVTDHLMPGMTGTVLANQVIAKLAIPVLIVSGYTHVESLPPELTRLTKPFRQADLSAALTRVLPLRA